MRASDLSEGSADLLIGIGVVFSGCQHAEPTPHIQVVERKVEIPQSLLRCLAEPKAKKWTSQKDVALFVSRLADAGADCHRKLGSVRRLMN